MALSKLFNLFALSSLAVIVCNLGVTPVNALALAHDGHHMVKVKRAHSAHDGVAKRRRDSSKRCKQRPSSSASASPSSTPAPQPTSSSEAPPPASSSSGSGSGGSGSGDSGSGSSGSGSGGGGKLGYAWPIGNDPSLKNVVSSKSGFIYTWSEQCPSLAKELGLTCMPQLWGAAGDRLAAWKSTVLEADHYASIALGFNEINEPGQAAMDVDTSVSIWREYMSPLKDQGYTLVAPVTSSNPNGKGMIQEFFQKCPGCADAIAVHYYGTDPQAMIDYIEDWYNTFKMPVYVTEYACQNFNTGYENNGQQCSWDQTWNFHKTVVQYMEGNPNVVTYCPFGYMGDMQGVNTFNQLLSGNQPTDLARAYMNGFS